jgi:hypothetical protein
MLQLPDEARHCNAMKAMISSAALPNVALSRPLGEGAAAPRS